MQRLGCVSAHLPCHQRLAPASSQLTRVTHEAPDRHRWPPRLRALESGGRLSRSPGSSCRTATTCAWLQLRTTAPSPAPPRSPPRPLCLRHAPPQLAQTQSAAKAACTEAARLPFFGLCYWGCMHLGAMTHRSEVALLAVQAASVVPARPARVAPPPEDFGDEAPALAWSSTVRCAGLTSPAAQPKSAGPRRQKPSAGLAPLARAHALCALNDVCGRICVGLPGQ